MPKYTKKFKKAACLFLFAFMAILNSHTVSAATTVNVSTPTIVATPTEIYGAPNPFLTTLVYAIDAPLTTFVSNGVRYWLDSIGSHMAKTRGTLDRPFQTILWGKGIENYFVDPLNVLGGPWRKIDAVNWTFDGGAAWIVNLYQVSNTELLAFVHIEQSVIINGRYTGGKNSIGLAWSSNAGESFTFLGDIIRFNNFDNRSEYNVQGAPYFIKDGYFYLYYHDLCPTAGQGAAATIPARAPVTEVINAAKNGKLSSWKKFYNGGFNSDALGGACTKINIANGIDHTDAAYSSYTGKYYITLSSAGTSSTNSWINLFESTDGINWTFLKTIANEPISPSGGFQYVSIVDKGGGDNGVVGNSFYVYSARNHTNASVYRWLVTLTASSSTTAPTPTLTPTPRPPTPTPTRTPTATPTGIRTPTPTGNSNPGDINGDGVANIIDIGIVIDSYNKNPPLNPKADINRDSLVNIIDVGIIIDNYTR